MKIVMDYDLCQGHATCMGEAPQVFRVDDDGTLTVLNENPDEEQRAQVEAAKKYCPTGAISVQD